MLGFRIPVVVEGKYDKLKVKQIVSSAVLSTEGFGVFNNREKRDLIAKAGREGVILLCDSDGGGKQIRSKLKGMLNGITVYDLYIPEIPGRERRKDSRSKAGLLGVEGMENGVLEQIFRRFSDAHPELSDDGTGNVPGTDRISRAFLYEMGLNGTSRSAENRKLLCRELGLPEKMTVNALAEILGIVSDRQEVESIMKKIRGD